MMAVSAEHDPTFWAEEVVRLEEAAMVLNQRIHALEAVRGYTEGNLQELGLPSEEVLASGMAMGSCARLLECLRQLETALRTIGRLQRERKSCG
jgi:hypothetical protein